MSKTITILTGSMRPNSVGDKLLPQIQQELNSREGIEVEVADPKDMRLPFIDSPVSPMAEDFNIDHDSVRGWQKKVQDSDALLVLAPEYNGQPSAVQKNAIDWLHADWKNKPVGIVSYGWGGGEGSAELLTRLFGKVGAKPLDTKASLFFTKDISLDGEVLDEASVSHKVGAVVDAVTAQ